MKSHRRSCRSWIGALVLVAWCAMPGAASATVASCITYPDWSRVTWTALGCDSADLIAESTPGAINFVGNQANPPAYFSYDSNYLYFRFRMDSDPGALVGLAGYSWAVLMQAPAGNRFQYQYELSVNGKDDTLQIWKNTTPAEVGFSPLFQDNPEQQLYKTDFRSTKLARRTTASTTFNGTCDYFVDWAVPIETLIAKGIITSASQLGQALFFPATASEPNTYDKSRLYCPFQPYTKLTVSTAMQPAIAPIHANTPVTITTTVQNTLRTAYGVVIEGGALPSYLTNPQVTVTSTDASAVFTVASVSPLRITAPTMAAGTTATVTLMATASPNCSCGDFTNTTSARATNAFEVSANALLDVQLQNPQEVCDGKDNDCDGTVDEGGAALCGDGNACTTDTCTGGVCGHQTIAGCQTCTTPSDCNDGNACTTETCTAGVCGHQPVAGCEPCTTAADCASDGNACTTETCAAGVCTRPATPGCVPCTTPSDCNDADACTTETCDAGICAHQTAPGCEPCETAADCASDGNACTTETCTDGVCSRPAVDGCVPCTTAAECDDAETCTTDTCGDGVCRHAAIENCVQPCETAADCDDRDACTTDACDAGACTHQGTEGCLSCIVVEDCEDGNACTTATCDAGVCTQQSLSGCIPCETDADCDDAAACTTDTCGVGKTCQFDAIPECVPCTTVDDCADGDTCTTDACTDAVCQLTPIEGCEPEQCTDGVDNDLDGAVDCDDSECNENPACVAEVCGDCVDNDGDGLVDYEDGDCCDATAPLAVRRMAMRMRPVPARNTFKLKARYAVLDPKAFNPTRDGTTLQISDQDGNVFCQALPVKTDSKRQKRGIFILKDKTGTMAGGLRRVKFKVRKDGRIVFRARGKKMEYRTPTGHGLMVTLRVGNQCTQMAAPMRTRRQKTGMKLVYP